MGHFDAYDLSEPLTKIDLLPNFAIVKVDRGRVLKTDCQPAVPTINLRNRLLKGFDSSGLLAIGFEQ